MTTQVFLRATKSQMKKLEPLKKMLPGGILAQIYIDANTGGYEVGTIRVRYFTPTQAKKIQKAMPKIKAIK